MADFLVNQQIKDFVFDLHDACRRSHMTDDIKRLYNNEFKDLSEKYCDKEPWPAAESISNQAIGNDGRPDEYFLCVYTEMMYRHKFAKLKTSLGDRLAAWDNYCALFDHVLGGQDLETELTAQWVFDVLHEFVYQFQSFCQYRTQNAGRSAEDRVTLEAADAAWSAPAVLSYLARLQAAGGGGTMSTGLMTKAPSVLHAQMALFAVASKSRVECLLGDYGAAVAAFDRINVFDEASELSKIFACRLSVMYHLGYSLMMLRRYRDALRTFDGVLAHLARTQKHNGFKAFGNEAGAVQKAMDRMMALFAVCLALAPGYAADDSALAAVKDKYGDKQTLMQRGDAQTFEAMLTYASPKHVVPAVPDYSAPVNASHDAYRQQISLFNAEVARQTSVAALRSYLKLYSSIDLGKLARFTDDTLAGFRAKLVGAKAKLRQGAPRPVGTAEVPPAALDIHFYVVGDMIHVDEPPKAQRHDEYFTAQIKKFDSYTAFVNTLKPNLLVQEAPRRGSKDDRD